MAGKGQGCAPEPACPAPFSVLRAFYFYLVCDSLRGKLGNIFLLCSSVLLLSWVWLALMGVLVICPPDFILLGLAGTNGVNWISVLYFHDQRDSRHVSSGQGAEMWTICAHVSLVKGRWGLLVHPLAVSCSDSLTVSFSCLSFPILLALEFS